MTRLVRGVSITRRAWLELGALYGRTRSRPVLDASGTILSVEWKDMARAQPLLPFSKFREPSRCHKDWCTSLVVVVPVMRARSRYCIGVLSRDAERGRVRANVRLWEMRLYTPADERISGVEGHQGRISDSLSNYAGLIETILQR